MAKEFNITGTCTPEAHYMVNISTKLTQIKKLIDNEKFFTINRGRQYGKTTTLSRLRRFLADGYTVISISFEGFGHDNFASEEAFCQEFLLVIDDFFESSSDSQNNPLVKNFEKLNRHITKMFNKKVKNFGKLNRHITKMCKNKKVVLMIDEVDKASDYRVFLDFLNTLRKKYLARADSIGHTFHSVILAGVYDIKNIKLKMISDGLYHQAEGERKINSPWNIAVPFEIEMSFCVEEVAGMLAEYEKDYHTDMDIQDISEEIYNYTSGYPFLVSQICKHIHEKLNRDWTRLGVAAAVRLMIKTPAQDTLFDDIFKNINNNKALSDLLYDILLAGEKFHFIKGDEVIATGLRYAFVKVVNEEVFIHNKIFEVLLANYFISKERREKRKIVQNVVEFDVISGNHTKLVEIPIA